MKESGYDFFTCYPSHRKTLKANPTNRDSPKMRGFALRRAISIALCVFVLGSLLLAEIANAGNAAYSITEFAASVIPTFDGKWTSPTEWTDAPHTFMTGNATGKFGYKIDFSTYGLIWIVEILTDNTNNTGDYWQICLDDSNTGGAAPQPGDYKIEITGHTTLKAYQGTGTGWAQVTPAAGEITWANTIGTSMWSSTPHWILEISDSDKTGGTIQVPNAPPTGMRVAAFDAATNTLAAWAPGDYANVPDQWGLVSGYSMDPIPEGFSLGAILIVASVAVLVGFYYLRKPKNTNLYKITL